MKNLREEVQRAKQLMGINEGLNFGLDSLADTKKNKLGTKLQNGVNSCRYVMDNGDTHLDWNVEPHLDDEGFTIVTYLEYSINVMPIQNFKKLYAVAVNIHDGTKHPHIRLQVANTNWGIKQLIYFMCKHLTENIEF